LYRFYLVGQFGLLFLGVQPLLFHKHFGDALRGGNLRENKKKL
jgi:hypothetical protein